MRGITLSFIRRKGNSSLSNRLPRKTSPRDTVDELNETGFYQTNWKVFQQKLLTI